MRAAAVMVAIQRARDVQDRNASLGSLVRQQAHEATMTMRAFDPTAAIPK
ncbi:MAG: hypothetical protein ABIS45_12000 [Burkholderiales bacterium]